MEQNEIKEKKVQIQTKYNNYMKLNIQDTQQIDDNIDPSNEQAEEEDDYFIIKESIYFNVDIKKDSIRNSDVINKHIIICGTHPSLYYFILPLRAKYLGEENLKWVVILANDISKEWDSISRFEKIIYINGSPLNTEDLYRANIEYADKAVILECENKVYSNYEDEMIDSESVFIYKAIKKCNENIQIMTELVYDSNIEFLLPKKELSSLLKNENSRIQYESTSLFAAGEVYISSIIDTLTCQAYYNPHIVTILYQLLTGGKNTSNVTMRGICENVGLKSSNLWQIPIHESFINKTFLELFMELAENHNCIALGIYRLPGAKDNDHPYVYTNPRPDTMLTHRDRIFVLAIDNAPLSLNNKNIYGNWSEKEERVNNNIFQNSISLEEMNNKSNKITPFRYLDDTLTEIENYVNLLEKNLKNLKYAVKETIGNAVKQEFSSILN